MVEPYHYVRFRWWKGISLTTITDELNSSFRVKIYKAPIDDRDLSIYKDERDELTVNADTLSAKLSPHRAILYQKKAAPFTAKDIELREKVLELYPRNRSTPFPWSFSSEPKFKKA